MTVSHAFAQDLLAVSTALARASQIEAVLGLVLESACRLVGAVGGRILVIQRNGRDLGSIAMRHAERPDLTQSDLTIGLYEEANRFNLAEPHVYCTVTGQTIILADVHAYSRFTLEALREADARSGFTTGGLILTPLWSLAGSTVGVLQLLGPDQTFLEADTLPVEHAAVLDALAALVAVALTNARLLEENRLLVRQIDRRNLEVAERHAPVEEERPQPLANVIGDSPPFKACLHFARRAAASNVPVLLLGETGTGKDVFAQAIHTMSERATMPFVAQNCAAIPGDLLESELFGHRRGAFTGATTDKKGLIQEAVGGTLFLDEIGDMPVALQVKLLRFLEDGIVRRLGDTRGQAVSVRLIAATNADLAGKIAAGQFREDLFYRLNVFPITLPPLRERQHDIQLLIEHFLTMSARALGRPAPLFSPRALDALNAWHYPGNIRELRNVIDRAVLLVDEGERIELGHLPHEMGRQRMRQREVPVAPLANGHGLRDAVSDFESMIIAARLREAGWNQSKAAGLLQISRRTLIEKLQRYSIRSPER